MAFESTQLILGSDYNSYPCAKECRMTLMASLVCPHTTNHTANVDLCCVLDKSGSMIGSRLNLMKDAVKFLVGQLRPQDRLTIVLFGSEVDTVLTMRPMDEEGKATALTTINQITADGQTNLSGALREGLTIMQQRGDSENVSSMMLFTDGQPTVGLRSAAEIIQGMNYLLPNMPSCCSLYTFGFGIDHDSELLYEMSKAGQGTYCYISKNEEIAAAFGDCSGGLLSVAAQNVKAVFRISDPNNCSLVKAELCSFYPTETNSNEFRIGDVFCDERKDLLFTVKIPTVSEERVYDLASITLTYFDLHTLNTVTETQTWKITRKNYEIFGNNWHRLSVQNNRLNVVNALKNCILAIKKSKSMYANKSLCFSSEEFEKVKSALEIALKEIDDVENSLDPYVRSVSADIKNIIEKANDLEAFMAGGSLHTLFNMLSSHCIKKNFEKVKAVLEIALKEINVENSTDSYVRSVSDDIKSIIEKTNDPEAFITGGGLHTLFNMLSSHSAQRCTATAYAEGQHQTAQREFNTEAKLESMTLSMRPRHVVAPVQPSNWFLGNASPQPRQQLTASTTNTVCLPSPFANSVAGSPPVPVDPNQTIVCPSSAFANSSVAGTPPPPVNLGTVFAADPQ